MNLFMVILVIYYYCNGLFWWQNLMLADFKYYSWISVTCETAGFNLAPPEFDHSVKTQICRFYIYIFIFEIYESILQMYKMYRDLSYEQQVHFCIVEITCLHKDK